MSFASPRVAGTHHNGAVASILTNLPALDPPAGRPAVEPLPADRPVRWGILATGAIARAFARNLLVLPDAEIAAVASRRTDSARAFADLVATEARAGGREHPQPRAYGSYEQLVADPDVDVVYVATPHALHKDNVQLAFEAGKPVLCEKALTLNARDARELVEQARARRLFFMEAMWMRCHPVVRRIRQLARDGALGAVQQVRADLGFRVDRPATDRLLAPELGGGALLDMGIYPLTFAWLLLGEPDQVAAAATRSPAGVDLNVSVSLGYASGAVASLSSTMTAWSPRTASVATDRGRLDLPEAFHPGSARWVADGTVEEITAAHAGPILGTGLANEAAEVIRCLRTGQLESPLVPLDETVALLGLMDTIRERIGVVYDADR
jgi:predicted dehydrogenase